MSRTLHCDRCGDEIKGQTDPLYVVRSPYNPNGGANAKDQSTVYDLCKRCAGSFRQWINPLRSAEGARSK